MPEPFTPNYPCSSSMEVPYQIDNIQSSVQLLKRGDYLLVEGKASKTPWVNAQMGSCELQKLGKGNQILVEVSKSAVTWS
jgi:hypothetical protein